MGDQLTGAIQQNTAIFLDTTRLMGGELDSNNYKMVIGNPDADSTFSVSWENLGAGLRHIEYTKRNEELLIVALRNQIRKLNFSELNEELEDDCISEEYYNNEIEKNGDKYAITLKGLEYPNDIFNIVDLVSKVSDRLRDFTLSEVSEMFSVKESALLDNIKSSNKIH